ncbi:hypothetical protein LOD99_2192 [Oopsacas minuta]|uniref:Uncharacterized protein n=1 Tax=Oopsacas minuta TaxID=111878 RepID=A0AAV7K284_9METZ|nr:hypothetical protein LOD99_2192 [Oopsacas minuta]
MYVSISAEEMGRNFEVDGKQVVDAHCDDKMFTTYYFKTKLKQERYNDEYRLKAIILGVTTTNTVIQDCKILLKKIQSFCVGL